MIFNIIIGFLFGCIIMYFFHLSFKLNEQYKIWLNRTLWFKEMENHFTEWSKKELQRLKEEDENEAR